MGAETKSTAEQKRPRGELAAAVSDRVQIEDVHLTELIARRGETRDGLPGEVNVITETDTRLDAGKLQIEVRPHLVLTARYKDSPEDFLRVEARFRLVYSLDSAEGVTQEHCDAFGQLNGMYNVWPYWRECVQSTTTRMGLPALTLPVFRLGQKKTAAAKPSRVGAGAKKPRRLPQGPVEKPQR